VFFWDTVRNEDLLPTTGRTAMSPTLPPQVGLPPRSLFANIIQNRLSVILRVKGTGLLRGWGGKNKGFSLAVGI